MADAVTLVAPARKPTGDETARDVTVEMKSDGGNRTFFGDNKDCVGFEFLYVGRNQKADTVTIQIPKDFKSLPKGSKIPQLGVGPEDTVKIASEKGAYKVTTVAYKDDKNPDLVHAHIHRIDFDGDGQPDLEIYQWTKANEDLKRK